MDKHELAEDAAYSRRVIDALTYLKDAEAKMVAQRTSPDVDSTPQLPRPRHSCD